MGDGGESSKSPYLTLILKLLSTGTAAGDFFLRLIQDGGLSRLIYYS